MTTWDETQASVEAAFGRGGPRVEVSEAIYNAFGRTPPANESLLQDLQEAGATAGGARGILQWLDDGHSAEEAARLGLSWGGVAPGKVRELVEERAAAVLKRHRPQSADPILIRESQAVSSDLNAAREAIVQAALERDRAYIVEATPEQRRRIAEAAAKPRIEALTARAIREGWSHDQLVLKLRQSAQEIREMRRSR